MKTLLSGLLMFLFTISSSVASKKYSFEDLKALEKSKNWHELLEHIEDIPPSKRNNEWNETLSLSMEKYFTSTENSPNSYSLEYYIGRYIDRYSQVTNKKLIFKVAKAVRTRISNTKAIKYFELGLSKQADLKLCMDQDLQNSIISSLNSPSKSDYAKIAKRISFGYCFDGLKKTIIKAIKESKYGLINACAEMIKRNSLKGITKKRCVRYLKTDAK